MSTPPTSDNSPDYSSTSRQQATVHHDVSTFLDTSFLSQLSLPYQLQPESTTQPLQHPREWLEAATPSAAMSAEGTSAQYDAAGATSVGSSARTPKDSAPAATVSRVSRACASCRGKKIRCEGGQPKCKNCLLRRIDCFYPEQKKRGRPSKAQTGQQPGDSLNQRPAPAPARRASPRKVSSGENSSSELYQIWQPERNGVHVSSEGCSMPLFSAGGELASDGSLKRASFPHSFSFDALGQSPGAASKTLPSSIASSSSHAFQLGYGGFNFGQQAANAVSPMDVTSPGVLVSAGGLGSGQTHDGGTLGQLLYSTSHSASVYTTPATGNIQHRLYNCSPQQPHPQQQQQRQPGPQDDYFGRAQLPSSLNTPLFHTSSAENRNLQGTTPSLPPNTRSFDSSGMHHTNIPQLYYTNGTPAFGDLKITTSRADSEGDPQMFSAAWNGATVAPLTQQPQSAIYSNQPFNFSTIVSDTPLQFAIPLRQPEAHPLLDTGFVALQRHNFAEKDLLSSTLGNVAIAIAEKDNNSDNLQKTMDQLSYLTANISNASQQAFEHAKEVAAEALATTDSAVQTDNCLYDHDVATASISESLLRMERRPDLSSKSVHNYFSYIHHQCPVIHKPTFLRQMDDGTVNRFVWFSLRALAARTLLHSHSLSKDDVLVEEAYFAAIAHKQLAVELDNPTVDVLQGLVLFALYILGTPRWEEASMYWCKAMRLAQLMGCNIIDAPSRAVATKMHFGIFEPPAARTVSRDNMGVIPGDLSGLHLPLTHVLTPLETELRRRLWWILFTNEQFGAVAERLPSMVDESRIFVHLPCSVEEWEKPVFTYTAPEKVPKYRRDGSALSKDTKDSHQSTLVQEMAVRKGDNLYMISDIEYGFAMGHLVTFLASMGSLFRPLSPYSNDYVQPFAGVGWQGKMSILQVSVDRIEGLFETARQDTLKRLNVRPHQGGGISSVGMPMQPSPGESRFKKRRDSGSDDGSDSKPKQRSTFQPAPARVRKSVDPVLDEKAGVPGIEIPHLYHLNMLILYSTLNIQLYRMVFQIHYDFSSSLPASEERQQDDKDLLAALNKYVKLLWQRATAEAQQVSHILRGESPNVPHWVLTLAGVRTADAAPSKPSQSTHPSTVGSNQPQKQQDATSSHSMMDVDSEEPASPQEQQGNATAQNPMSHRLKRIFRERIKSQEKRLHEMATSVFTSYRRTVPYALLLAVKVHVDNIKWWTNEKKDVDIARAYLDLAAIVQFLETHQTSFSSTDYVALVKSMMQAVDISS